MGKQRVTNEDFKSYEERRRDAYIAYAQEQWGKPENSAASEAYQSGAYSDESPAAYSARQEREGAERPASVLWLDQQRPKQYEENSAVDHYLANPQNVNRLYLQYQTDERFRDPDYSKEEVSQVYDYYKTRNRGRRVEDWQGAGVNDPIVPILAQLPNRQERAFTSDEIYGYQPTEREAGFFTPQRVGSWDELDLAGKIGRATDASADLSLCRSEERRVGKECRSR